MAHQPALVHETVAIPSPAPSLVSKVLKALRHESTAPAFDETQPLPANIDRRCIRLLDKACDGVRVRDLSKTCGLSITISQVRPRRERTVREVCPDTRLRQGDTIVVVGPRTALDTLCEQVGGQSAPLDYLDFADKNTLLRRLKRITWH